MPVEAYRVTGTAYERCDKAVDVFESWPTKRRSLVLPTCCVGNVAQLAVDLILTSLQHRAEHVAMLRHPLVLPCFGVNPYGNSAGRDGLTDGSGGITTHAAHPMDLYRIGVVGDDAGEALATDVYVLQQRSPASAGCQVAFAKDLISWICDAQFDEVWILGSLNAEYRRDADLNAPSEDGTELHNIKCVVGDSAEPLGKRCRDVGMSPLGEMYMEMKEADAHMPWAMLRAAREGGACAAGVVKFVLEGDNRMDAVEMAKVMGRLLGVGVDARHVPTSWFV